MYFKNILIEEYDGLAIVTINRPEKLNALNNETITELHEILDELNRDENVRVIFLRGSGEKAFVAGADILEFVDFSQEEGQQLSEKGHYLLFDFIENLTTPTIALINGFALGGGLELAMACHFRIATENAKMGLPETSLGLIPGYGGTQRLPQLVGKGKAMEMIMTARMISAEQAKSYGLVNYVVKQENLIPFAEKIAEKIMRNSPVAIGKAIKSVNDGFKNGIDGFQSEIRNFGSCFDTDDFIEGTNAFLEKRKPEF